MGRRRRTAPQPAADGGGAPDYAVGRLPIDRLSFDPGNPRLPRRIDRNSETAILKWMLEDATLLELIGSIASDGYFPGEPVLVSPDPEGPSPEDALADDGQRFLVVEGNRRLASIKLLNRPELAPTRKRALRTLVDETLGGRAPENELPVIVFPRRVDVLDHLGYRHITGIKEWTPLAKANYVRELLDRAREQGEELSLSEAARMIGSKGWYVGRLLAALAAVEKLQDDKRFFSSLGVEEEDLPFSLMLVALSRENIVDYLGLRTANSPDLPGLKARELKRLATWLFKKRNGGKTALGESRNMTYLAQVVTSPDAMKALDDGQNVQAAAVLALDAHKILRVAVSESQEQVDLAIRQEPRLKQLRVDDLETVQTLGGKVDTLVTLVESKVRARPKR